MAERIRLAEGSHIIIQSRDEFHAREESKQRRTRRAIVGASVAAVLSTGIAATTAEAKPPRPSGLESFVAAGTMVKLPIQKPDNSLKNDFWPLPFADTWFDCDGETLPDGLHQRPSTKPGGWLDNRTPLSFNLPDNTQLMIRRVTSEYGSHYDQSHLTFSRHGEKITETFAEETLDNIYRKDTYRLRDGEEQGGDGDYRTLAKYAVANHAGAISVTVACSDQAANFIENVSDFVYEEHNRFTINSTSYVDLRELSKGQINQYTGY